MTVTDEIDERVVPDEDPPPGIWPTVVQIDDQLIVFHSGYAPGMTLYPQCTARTSSGERCDAELRFCGTSVIQILGADAVVFARVSPLPAECFTRQRCPAHLNAGDDATPPEWEPFTPERHPDTLARLIPRWSPRGIWAPSSSLADRPWGTWVKVDHSAACPFGDHVPLADSQAYQLEYEVIDDFTHREQAASAHARWSALIGDHIPELAAVLGTVKVRAPKVPKVKAEAASPVAEPAIPEAEESQAGPTALYRYYDAGDLLLYIGISDRLRNRTGDHVSGSSWMDFAVRSTIERHPTRAIALDVEEAAIKAERPLFNHQHNDSPEARQRLVEYLVGHGRLDLLAPAVSRG